MLNISYCALRIAHCALRIAHCALGMELRLGLGFCRVRVARVCCCLLWFVVCGHAHSAWQMAKGGYMRPCAVYMHIFNCIFNCNWQGHSTTPTSNRDCSCGSSWLLVAAPRGSYHAHELAVECACDEEAHTQLPKPKTARVGIRIKEKEGAFSHNRDTKTEFCGDKLSSSSMLTTTRPTTLQQQQDQKKNSFSPLADARCECRNRPRRRRRNVLATHHALPVPCGPIQHGRHRLCAIGGTRATQMALVAPSHCKECRILQQRSIACSKKRFQLFNNVYKQGARISSSTFKNTCKRLHHG